VVTRLSDDALRKAVAHGRWLADELRSLETLLDAAGLPLVAFSDPGPVGVRRGTIQMQAVLSDANRAEVMGAVDDALERLHQVRSAVMPLDLIQIDLVPAAAAAGEPPVDDDLPRVVRITDGARIERLRARAEWTMALRHTPEGGLQRPSSQLRPRLDQPEQDSLTAAVRAEVASWLATQGLPGHVNPGTSLGWSFVLAESLDLLRVYVLVCPPELEQCNTDNFTT